MLFPASLLALLALAASPARALKTQVQIAAKNENFVHSLEDEHMKHRLRLCNAYPYSAALDVFGVIWSIFFVD